MMKRNIYILMGIFLIFLTVGSFSIAAQEKEVFPGISGEESGSTQPTAPAEIPNPPAARQVQSKEAMPIQAEPSPVGQKTLPAKASATQFARRQRPEIPKITVRLSDVTLSVFFRAISQQTKANFIIAEGLEQKKVTAFLDGVSLEEALGVILGMKGLAYEKIPGQTNTYLITQRKEEEPRTTTRIFELNYIPLQNIEVTAAPGEDRSQSASGIILGGGGTLGGDGFQAGAQQAMGGKAMEITSVIATLLSKHGRIAVDTRTNSLIITDLPERFSQIETMIRDLDKKSPQVTIEAQLVELSSDGMQRLGLEYGGPSGELARFVGPSRYSDFGIRPHRERPWSGSFFTPSQGVVYEKAPFSAPGATAVNMFETWSGVTAGVLSFNEFQILLRAIVTRAQGKILSRPKIMTINNKTAEIRVTASEAIGIVSASNLQGSFSGAERRDTGIILRVTPQVNSDGYITMVVEPSVSRTTPSTIGNFKDPVKRSVKSMVRVRDGDTIVVGGLIDTREENVVRKVPILGSIPILGWLFTDKSTTKRNSELAIFITPTVLDE